MNAEHPTPNIERRIGADASGEAKQSFVRGGNLAKASSSDGEQAYGPPWRGEGICLPRRRIEGG